jgi:phospholipid/cholesterol/gamma-HCH transport system substrate-binding protein
MKAETKVGILFLLAVVMVVAFAYFLGDLSPFSNSKELNIAYNFAGGIEEGSPVRVMGIKVGKVKEIVFDPNLKMPDGEEVKLRLRITVDKKAWPTVREDSQFYINLAGVIGEKFIEVTPGSSSAAELKPGQMVRGEDPPRVDQLISQSYGLAGKIIGVIEKNEGSVIETLEMMNNLVNNLNKVLKQVESTSKNKEVVALLKNMVVITDDMAFFTQRLRSEKGQETMKLLHKLLWRLEGMDAKAIKKFFQEEGIRAKMF